MSWFTQGYEGMKREEDRIAGIGNVQRFWMPVNSSKEIVFVDDEPVCISEHNPKINGGFKNWLTCVRGMYDDTACCDTLGVKTRYFVGYYTVVDLSKFVSNKGNTYQFELKLLPAKLGTAQKLKRKKEQKGSLVGKLYNVTRNGDKSPGVGDEFEYVRDVDMDKLFQLVNIGGKKLVELFAKADGNVEQIERLKRTLSIAVDDNGKIVRGIPGFNYAEILQPKTPKEIKAFLKGVEVEGEESASGGDTDAGGPAAPSGEDIPF